MKKKQLAVTYFLVLCILYLVRNVVVMNVRTCHFTVNKGRGSKSMRSSFRPQNIQDGKPTKKK